MERRRLVRPARRTAFSALLLLLLALGASPAGGARADEVELIVGFRSGVTAAGQDQAVRGAGGTTGRRFGRIRARVVRVRGAAARTALERNPHVRYVEPNRRVSLDALPNDARFGELWGLHNTGQTVGGLPGTPDADVDAPEAWDVTTGTRRDGRGDRHRRRALAPRPRRERLGNPGEVAGNGRRRRRQRLRRRRRRLGLRAGGRDPAGRARARDARRGHDRGGRPATGSASPASRRARGSWRCG